jgi:hypothetical protein
MPFSKIFPSSRFLNLLKKGLESPGKVLEFHLHQRVDSLSPGKGGAKGGGVPNQTIATTKALPKLLDTKLKRI